MSCLVIIESFKLFFLINKFTCFRDNYEHVNAWTLLSKNGHVNIEYRVVKLDLLSLLETLKWGYKKNKRIMIHVSKFKRHLSHEHKHWPTWYSKTTCLN